MEYYLANRQNNSPVSISFLQYLKKQRANIIKEKCKWFKKD